MLLNSTKFTINPFSWIVIRFLSLRRIPSSNHMKKANETMLITGTVQRQPGGMSVQCMTLQDRGQDWQQPETKQKRQD